MFKTIAVPKQRLVVLAGLLMVSAFTAVGQVGTTWRAAPISASSAGVDTNRAAMSADGRFIVFTTAYDMESGDKNGLQDIYRSRPRYGPERVSLPTNTNTTQAHKACYQPTISADGNYIAFVSSANNLVPGDTNNALDVFVRDYQAGITQRVSVSSSGAEANLGASEAAISANGRFVVFSSTSSNLVPGDTNNDRDVFVYDRQTKQTERVSVSSTGGQGAKASYAPAISADGRIVCFLSYSTNLVPDGVNYTPAVFAHDRQTRQTTQVSLSSTGEQANHLCDDPEISADGRFVTFSSYASNLVTGDTNGTSDIFVRDRYTGATTRVSVSSSGEQANALSETPFISGNGRFVTFSSTATNLIPNDGNNYRDIFVHDRQTGITERVSVSSTNEIADNASYLPVLNADGRFILFNSIATNLAPQPVSNVPFNGSVYFRTFRNGVQGDVDGDGCVNDFDLFAVIQDFLAAPGSISGKDTDVDNNGVVNDSDLFLLTQYFLQGC